MKINQPFLRVSRSPTFVARVGRKRHRGPDGLAKDQVRPRVVDCLSGPLASITAIAALTVLAVVRSVHVPGSWVLVLCPLAGVIAVLGAAVYDYLFTRPRYPSTISIPGT